MSVRQTLCKYLNLFELQSIQEGKCPCKIQVGAIQQSKYSSAGIQELQQTRKENHYSGMLRKTPLRGRDLESFYDSWIDKKENWEFTFKVVTRKLHVLRYASRDCTEG